MSSSDILVVVGETKVAVLGMKSDLSHVSDQVTETKKKVQTSSPLSAKRACGKYELPTLLDAISCDTVDISGLSPNEVTKTGDIDVVDGELRLRIVTSLGNFLVTRLSVKDVIPKLRLGVGEEEEEEEEEMEEETKEEDGEEEEEEEEEEEALASSSASSCEELLFISRKSPPTAPLSPANPPSVTSSLTSNGSQPHLEQPSFLDNNESTILVNDITSASDPEVTLNISATPAAPTPGTEESERIASLEERNTKLEVQLNNMRKEMINMQGLMGEMLKMMRSSSSGR